MAQALQEKPGKKKNEFELEMPQAEQPKRNILNALNPMKGKEMTEDVGKMQKDALDAARKTQRVIFKGQNSGQGKNVRKAPENRSEKMPVNEKLDSLFTQAFEVAAKAASAPESSFNPFADTKQSLFGKFGEIMEKALAEMEKDPSAAGLRKWAGIQIAVANKNDFQSALASVASKLMERGVISRQGAKKEG